MFSRFGYGGREGSGSGSREPSSLSPLKDTLEGTWLLNCPPLKHFLPSSFFLPPAMLHKRAMEERIWTQQQLLVLLNISSSSSSSSSQTFGTFWPPSSASSGSGSAPEPSPGGEEGGEEGEASATVVGVSPWDVVLCATGTAVACENALVLALLLAGPGLRAAPFLLIGSLALADLLAGLGLVVNFGVQYLLPPPPNEAAALGAAGLLMTAFAASLGSLLAITVDRYLSLCQALTYRAPAAPLLALVWLPCLVLGLLPLLGWNCLRQPAACSILRPVTRPQAALLAAALLLLFLLLLQLDLRICRIATRHAQQIALQRQLSTTAACTSARKGLSTLALVLGTFALCWLPLAIYSLVADASYPPVLTYSLALPAACNSLLNPLIYAFRHPDIQKSLWLACCGGCSPSGLPSRTRTPSDV